jgi:peptidoglycan/LPS O-acetylase OafA/YrhL
LYFVLVIYFKIMTSNREAFREFMSIAYRPEIDGLRTVSVMLVIFNHLGWSLFSGGFIGVDVFFVISGYLITTIVHKEIQANEFSFIGFYKRRVLRLAPAYFTVLTTVTIISLVMMLPDELIDYFNSVVYSTFFLVNVYLARESGGYFTINADTIPLLHLWSLSVEEQFYIFWPVILLFLTRRIRPKSFFPVVFILLIVGIIAAIIQMHHDPEKAYFLLPTRFFELLIGAILVFIPRPTLSRIHGNLLGLLGLSLIFIPAFFYYKAMYFPGLTAIVPCLGAALILVFCDCRTGSVGVLLSMRPMVYLGKLSYPAYLWHWPIIAFINLRLITIDWKVSSLVIVITILLSHLTYRYLEIPAQKFKRYPNIKVFSLGFFLPAIAFISLAVCAQAGHGWIQRLPKVYDQKIEALDSFAHVIRGDCSHGDVEKPASADQCVLGIKSRPVDFLLIGDSHANAITGMVDVMATHAGIRGYDITQDATIFMPNVQHSLNTDGSKVIKPKKFYIRNKAVAQIIQKGHYKAVILAGRFAEAYNEGVYEVVNTQLPPKVVFEQNLGKAIALIQRAGSRAIIINDVSELGKVKAECTLNNQRFDRTDDCNINLIEDSKLFEGWNAALDRLSKQYPDLIIIDPKKVTCDLKTCFSQIDGIPLYRNHDENHLNYIGSELIGTKYIAQFGNPLLVINAVKPVNN